MKKSIALLLTVILLFSAATVNAGAVSLNEGKAALEEQFKYGRGPESNGYALDYRYYSPVKGNGDETKYPVVIWLHGLSHGQYEGFQIRSNNITNWASDEYQSRFTETSGAYIVAVRAPENIGISWNEEALLITLKDTIDDFILKNTDTVNPSKIYAGGFSMGGLMTFKMATAYPEMFAAIFPVCPYITIDENDAVKFADVPVWLTSGKKDIMVSYSRVLKDWNAVVNTTRVPEDCRLSTLEKTCNPDGSAAATQHNSWEAVTNDMFSSTNGDYPYMSTVSAKGEEIELTYPDGMISWLEGFSSGYTVQIPDINNAGGIDIVARLIGVFRVIYIFFRNLLRPITG